MVENKDKTIFDAGGLSLGGQCWKGENEVVNMGVDSEGRRVNC